MKWKIKRKVMMKMKVNNENEGSIEGRVSDEEKMLKINKEIIIFNIL